MTKGNASRTEIEPAWPAKKYEQKARKRRDSNAWMPVDAPQWVDRLGLLIEGVCKRKK